MNDQDDIKFSICVPGHVFRYSLAFVAFAVLLLRCSSAAAEQPNVLFIAVDDLRVELGCYGCEHVHSPHIDKLAKRGTLFTHAYCQQTICNPSRASVMTGLRPDTLRVWDLPTHFRANKPDVVTLPQLFKQHGYHTQGIGKIFHNWRQDKWRGDAASWSVPAVLHYNSHYNDKPILDGPIPADLTKMKLTECREVPDDAYFDGRIAKQAVEALRKFKEDQTPFFLAVGFWKPHTPFNAPKRYWDLYDPKEIPLPGKLQPPVNVPEIALTPDRFTGSQADLRELHHGHLAAISYLDAQVGLVLETLQALGLDQNTVVIFWSDHGLHIGEHGLMRKTTAFELDAGVPLILSTPGQTVGQRCDGMVELLDIYPTLVELCDLQVKQPLEGLSLVPLLKNPNATLKPVALTQAVRPNYLRGKLPQSMGYSIRSPRYRYTEWREWESGKVEARELYDHQKDHAETENVVAEDSYAEVVNRLEILLQKTLQQKQN